MTNKKALIIALVIILAVAYTPAQAATTYYVAVTGNDQNFGTQVSPYRTIQKCINMAGIGDLCSIGAGTYNERFNINKPVTVSCIVKHACVIQGATLGSGAVIDGFYSLNNPLNDGGIVGSGSGYKIISNKVEGSCMVGIKMNGSNGLAENNEILKSRQCAGSSGPDADGIRYFGAGQVIRGNYIHDIFYNSVNTTAHIDCFQTWGGASGALIEGNICDNYTANTTLAGSGANLENDTGAIFRNNYFRTWGKKIMIESSSSGTVIENNIFIGGALTVATPVQYGLFGNGSGEVARNNIFYNINSSNNTSVLLGVVNGGGNLLNTNPNMSGYCSVSYPKIGVLCGVLPVPTNTPSPTPSASPSPLPVPNTATSTPVLTRTPVPTVTFECLLFPVHNQRVCLP